MLQRNDFRLSASHTDSLPWSSTLQQNSWWTMMKYSSVHICKWPSNILSKWPPTKCLTLKWNSSWNEGTTNYACILSAQTSSKNKQKEIWLDSSSSDSKKQMRRGPVSFSKTHWWCCLWQEWVGQPGLSINSCPLSQAESEPGKAGGWAACYPHMLALLVHHLKHC